MIKKIKSLKSEIFKAVIIAVVLGIGGYAVSFAKSVPDHFLVKREILKKLQLYEQEVNADAFNAHHYFSSDVARFFDMYKTTPAGINSFWKKRFDLVFGNMSIKFDYSTLEITRRNGEETKVSIEMYSSYYNKKEKKEYRNEHSRYDMIFDEDYRMTYLVQEIYN